MKAFYVHTYRVRRIVDANGIEGPHKQTVDTYHIRYAQNKAQVLEEVSIEYSWGEIVQVRIALPADYDFVRSQHGWIETI